MFTSMSATQRGARVAYSLNSTAPVQIWNLQTYTLESEFKTIIDGGGNHLAIMSAGDRVLAGAFARHGVALYSTSDGRRLWQNKSVKRLNDIRVTFNEQHAWCISLDGVAWVLDLEHGEVVERVTGMQWRRHSPFDESAIWSDGKRLHMHGQDGHQVMTSATRFENRFIDGAFGRASLCVSEGLGPLRCFEIGSGNEMHRVPSGDGWHWTIVGYAESGDEFFVVRRNFAEASSALYRFVPTTGEIVRVCDLTSLESIFCVNGDMILGADGDLRRTSDGLVVHDFRWSAR